jgi:hypothetical protein
MWIRIPPVALTFVYCECCMLSGRGLRELITRPGESYSLCCVVVCDLETWMRRSSPTGGCRARNKQKNIWILLLIFLRHLHWLAAFERLITSRYVFAFSNLRVLFDRYRQSVDSIRTSFFEERGNLGAVRFNQLSSPVKCSNVLRYQVILCLDLPKEYLSGR